MVMKKGAGFTLLETMVVLAIAGILLGVGVPRLTVFFQNGRMVTNTNAMVSAFKIAKSEAVKRQSYVTLCRSADQATCDLDADNTWEDGWIVFQDLDGDRVVDAGNDVILRINEGAEGGDVTIRSDTTDQNVHQYVTFTSRGHPKNGNTLVSATYIICDDRDNLDAGVRSVAVDDVSKTLARGVILSMSGKARSTRDANKISDCNPAGS